MVASAGGAGVAVGYLPCLGSIARQSVVGWELVGEQWGGGWLPARGRQCRQVQGQKPSGVVVAIVGAHARLYSRQKQPLII